MQPSIENNIQTEPWVGLCYAKIAKEIDSTETENKTEDLEPQYDDIQCTVAVWANSFADFEDKLKTALTKRNWLYVWVDDALPVLKHLARLGHHQDLIELSRSVNQIKQVAFAQHQLVNSQSEEVEETQDYLIIETIADIKPLEDEFPKTKSVPDALQEPLFAQPENVDPDAPPLKTYLILEGAKILQFQQRMSMMFLQYEDLQHRCLFKGQVATDMEDVAPYLIDLDYKQPEGRDGYDPTFDNAFLLEYFTKYWDKGCGIFIRSTSSLDELWHHFRKFTRIQDGNNKWFYLRFYDPVVAQHYLATNTATSLKNSFYNADITCFIPITEGKSMLKVYQSDKKKKQGKPIFTEVDMDLLSQTAFQSFIIIATKKLKETPPYKDEIYSSKLLREWIIKAGTICNELALDGDNYTYTLIDIIASDLGYYFYKDQRYQTADSKINYHNIDAISLAAIHEYGFKIDKTLFSNQQYIAYISAYIKKNDHGK